jgi:predicted ferric reductase
VDMTAPPRTAPRSVAYGLHRRQSLQRATQILVWGIVAANIAIIVGLWLQGGGVSAVHRTGDLYTSLGRITGLISAFLALIQVLLLARMPFMERLAGFDRLTVWHRLNGKACIYLIVGHVVFITVGYALTDRISVPAEVSTFLSSYPGMVTATFGTLMFFAIMATSIVIVRRRMRYEAWYAVHLMAYAAVALAWFHQIPTGNEFAASPGAATYWRSLYAGTAVLLVLFRVVQPIVHAFRYRLRVSEVWQEGPNVVSLRISGRNLDRFNAQPGQFLLWRFLARGCWWESHPFSLSEAPDGRSLRITVKALGDFTAKMDHIRVGTRVVAEGPFGTFTAGAQRRERVTLIAGGIGITPIRSLLETMQGDLTLVYRVVQEEDLLFRVELEALAAARGITLHYVVGDHRTPGNEHLMSAQHLLQLVPNLVAGDVFLCGPPAMARILEANIRAAGVPSRLIHAERFALSA